MNPFKYGSIVLGSDFCGRKDLLCQITGHMNASQNIVVLGERRIGKSSLIYEAVRKIKGTDIFVETKMTPDEVVKTAEKLIEEFGYNRNDLRIEAS